MKKKITLVFSLMATTIAFGQVGINTTTPQATLDVVGKKGATDKDGLIAPRLTRAELTAKGDALYGAPQNGTIIFITDITGGNANTQRVNITETGYYYFDSASNRWQKMPSKNEVTALEPWQVENSTSKATQNTQNIYQNGKIAIGDFSARTNDSRLKITGGGSAALGIETSDVGTFYNISVEPGGLTFTQRRPNNARQFLFKTDGSFQIGKSLFNSTASGPNNSASFFYDGPTSRLAINTASDPTESIDTGGNIRIRTLPDSDPITSPYKVVAKTDGTLGKELDITGSVQFATGSFQNLDLTNTTRANLKDIYFFSHGATITLPKATNELVGVKLTFYISGGSTDSYTTGLTQEFSVSMPATDVAANSILGDPTNTSPYNNLISSWSGTKITFVNNRSRIFRALNFKLVSNGTGVYRWMFWASGV
ncbi:hypothetical protein ACQ7CX_20885 [Chryseobacterium arthrosphaerae]|uniref:hypothetical protein n=1 Tax=Chryseobacterium arthrosphaerae TaxID=651561 RepID=UPI001BAEF712|nr:hypothetical protein [Chryseobacterium arthrosphaerae]QUY56219.1 hypothetical protein I2F65_02380 [Chryseobacterium arthrosphaerae]